MGREIGFQKPSRGLPEEPYVFDFPGRSMVGDKIKAEAADFTGCWVAHIFVPSFGWVRIASRDIKGHGDSFFIPLKWLRPVP